MRKRWTTIQTFMVLFTFKKINFKIIKSRFKGLAFKVLAKPKHQIQKISKKFSKIKMILINFKGKIYFKSLFNKILFDSKKGRKFLNFF